MSKRTTYNLYAPFLAFLVFLSIFVLSWCMFNTTTYAASAPLEYELLVDDIPGLETAVTPGEYLSGMVKLIIGLTTVLAVLMMVIAGIEHVGGAAKESSRSAAKERMWGALLGLILALISYIILNTINPDLLTINVTL